MVQLRVYDNGTQYWLDLYEESPIKINLSVEDITSTDTTSAFTRTFRVPGTAHNNGFFKHAFYVDSIDYDVTVKKKAELLVDGEPFREGHIRLQKILNNNDLDRVDYEIVFLGETRDFASALGDSPMCQIDLDLSHVFAYDNIRTSWQAYPEGNLTDGLLNGDVIYPLIDHGNTYDSSGDEEQTRIATTTAHTNGSFIQNSAPLDIDRFKPMIRAKALFDAIFAQTDYTYESEFLESNLFRKMYVSAFGNDSSIYTDLGASTGLFEARRTTLQQAGGGDNLVECNVEIFDPGSNYSTTTFRYTAPVTGSYTFTANADITATGDWGSTAYGTAEIHVNGVQIASGSAGQSYCSVGVTTALTAGDYVEFVVEFSPNTDQAAIIEAIFKCTSSPANYSPISNLDCEYKQIDFVRDIITMFRLVMAPKKGAPNVFIIEPWVNFIGSGQIFDWTQKLDRSKDIQLEPLFFTQSDRIEFKFEEDEDFINDYNQRSFKEVYGQLNYDSDSELLKDTRDVGIGMAPTPFSQIEGEPNTSAWCIPKIHTHDSGEAVLEHLPIRAKTRILFYNGLYVTPDTWYMLDGSSSEPQTEYPLVSYHENWPPTVNDLNLNWNRQFAYYGTNIIGYNGLLGQSLFERYWSTYVASLYNKFSRRLTAYFVLDNRDLIDFSFDDVIFIDGTYYRPEKIVDAPVGLEDRVKVQLIKLNTFKPSDQETPVQFYYYEARIDLNCSALSSQLYILQSTTPLNNGDYVSVAGSADCFVIMNPASTTIWDYTVTQIWGSCNDCQSGSTIEYVYRVNRWNTGCTGLQPENTSVSSTTPIATGSTVNLTNTSGCWYVTAETQVLPVDTVSTVHPDCETCFGASPEITYLAYYCGTTDPVYVSSNVDYVGGEVVRINDACKSCVTIDRGSTQTPQFDIIDVVYPDCATCNNQNFGDEFVEFDDNCREFDGI